MSSTPELTQESLRNWPRHLLLFVLAFASCMLAGMAFAGEKAFALESWKDSANLLQALSYAGPVMLILLAHEMGHWVQAWRHQVPASLPYFLPGLPIPGVGVLPMIGTLGAVIRMDLDRLSARSLLQVGAWGPLAGFILLVPTLLLGMSLSEIRPLPEDINLTMRLGDTLLLLGAEAIFFPDIPPGHDVFLHPMAMAGWTGMLLTAINLLPISQLDGGHILYCVFGERFNKIVWPLFALIVLLGLTFFASFLLLALIIWRIGPEHPDILDGEPLRGHHRFVLPVASLIMFVLCFSPEPIVLPSLLELAWEATATWRGAG